MKLILLVLAGFMLIYFGQPQSKKKFALSEKQKAAGWYVQNGGNDIVKVMHPVYGYLKTVSLTAPELKLSKTANQNIQTIDLRDVDTSFYENMFINKDFFPASGISGSPIQIGDFDHDGLLDFYGAYKWVQDFQLADACVVELNPDSSFQLKRIYGDTLIRPLPSTDLDKDGLQEINFRQNRKFAQLKSTITDSFPDSISFLYRLWKGGGGEVGAETLADLDKDGKMDMIYVGDDTLEPPGAHKIYVAEYNKDINNFEEKFRFYPPDRTTYGYSYGDFDGDGFTEFVTGSIHGDVYVFENSGNDKYSLINQDTLSTSNAFLTVATNDIDSNGKTEFFVGGSSYFNGIGGTRFYWFEAEGNNSYKKVRSFFLLGVDPLSWDEIHTFDVNNDGKDDILINYTYAIVILTWNNDAEEFEVFYFSKWENTVQGVTMFDLDNNGKSDLFISVLEHESTPALRTYYYQNNTVTSIKKPIGFVPESVDLKQNFPNPFNGRTTILFSVNKKELISLSIYNSHGKEVRKLIKSEGFNPGNHEVSWDTFNNDREEVASGIYYYVLRYGQQHLSRKMLLIK